MKLYGVGKRVDFDLTLHTFREAPHFPKPARMAAAAAKAEPHPQRRMLLGEGTYGCVVSAELELQTERPRPVPLLHVPDFGGAPAAFKLMNCDDSSTLRTVLRVTRALSVVDPEHDFTVPIEELAELTAEAVRATAPISRSLLGASEILRMRMRRGIPIVQWLPRFQLADCHKPLQAVLKLARAARRMHEHGIAHGDIKLDNIVYFETDDTLRLIDFDLMFGYDQRCGDFTYERDAFREQFQRKTPRDLMVIIKNANIAATTVGEAYNFPPDNVFMNPRELFRRDDEDNWTIYQHFTNAAPKLNAAWTDCMQGEFKSRVAVLRTLGRNLFYANSREIVAQNYHPDKHMVFQLGYVVYAVTRVLLDRFSELGCDAELMDFCSLAMMPLGSLRPSWDVFLSLLEARVQAVQAAEAAEADTEPESESESESEREPDEDVLSTSFSVSEPDFK